MTGLLSLRGWVGRRAPSTRAKTANMVAMLAACAPLLTFGCIDRPVAPSEPNTTNVFANQIEVQSIDAIDLLFVIDNSTSMADKQALLRDAVPLMVQRLITPDCVDDSGHRQASDGQNCASYGAQYVPEFRPVDDIHLGVITSSLGGFGSLSCKDPERNDRDLARLIPKVRSVVSATGEAVPDPTQLGFLSWTGVPDGADAEAAKATLQRDLALHVAAAGEIGCGFEAPLEAWYRFLVDPEPPAGIELVKQGSSTISRSTGVDTELLEQRAEFLRPGSLVAIVVLSDENDCSVMEGGSLYPNAGVGWLLPDTKRAFATASAACAESPNDPCCYSCFGGPPAGCEDTCPASPDLALADDRANVRCFDNKRRFGVDLLYPTERYVDALSKSTIMNSRTGEPAQNPLLTGRSPDLVFFAGIVGVPWQDVATDASLADESTLVYRSASELDRVDADLGGSRWDLLLGTPGGEGVPAGLPLDPFMIESIGPRSGTHPLTGDPIVAPGSTGWSPINGHEYDNSVPFPSQDKGPSNDDLQYSCIFPLAADAVKTDCTGSDACDCSDEPRKQRPLCKPSPNASVPADTTQRYGKAYPPSRILRVLRDFGDNSIVASICPKITNHNSPAFGYNPAVNAIVDRLASKLNGQCLPRPLSTTEGNVPCALVEATHEKVACNAGERRAELSLAARAAIERRMVAGGTCKARDTDPGTLPSCSEFTVCEILEATDDAKARCFDGTPPEQQEPGYCYIDPAKGPDAGGFPSAEGSCIDGEPSTWGGCINPHVLACEATRRRILRFVGERTPQPNSTTYVACAGDAASQDGQLPALPDPED